MNREDFYRTVSMCVTVDYCKGWNAAVNKIFDELEKQNKVNVQDAIKWNQPNTVEAIGHYADIQKRHDTFEPWW